MKRRYLLSLVLLMLGVVCADARQRGAEAASPNELAGTWSGTWEGGGAGSGGFELTLEKGKDGVPTGRVAVTGEPSYKAAIRTISFEARKMTAAYDFPPDETLEVVLTATFEGETAKGAWTARQKSGGELASGTWTVTRK